MRAKPLCLFITGGFFLIASAAAGQAQIVRINEVAWMGTEVSHNNEWIELYNPGETAVDLAGWKVVAEDGQPEIELSGTIKPNTHFLLERTGDETVPGVPADLIYTGALGNSGEVLRLVDEASSTVDTVNAADGWPAGDNDSKQTMELGPQSEWQTSRHSSGTPGQANSPGEEEETEESEESDKDAPDKEAERIKRPRGKDYEAGDIVINEFVSDPADGRAEWIELYNNSGSEIILDEWFIQEGAGSETRLTGPIDKFKVIEKLKGNLNNSGDVIQLVSESGKLIDQVAYGDWDDGDASDNAPAARDPASTARRNDGKDGPDDASDFSATITPTPGSANRITEEESRPKEAAGRAETRGVVITEIHPNPQGSDREDEFVELFNAGEKEVDLSGWILGDESKRRFELPAFSVLEPDAYLVIYRQESKIAFNNNGDTVRLCQTPDERSCLETAYDSAPEGKSYCRTAFGTSSNFVDPDKKWIWSDPPTPGEWNILDIPNHPPQAAFSYTRPVKPGRPVLFDSSDSIDLDGDTISFFWDFGDSITNRLAMPTHTFLKAGVFEVRLLVSDGQATTTKKQGVTVGAPDEAMAQEGVKGQAAEVIINELMPSPSGSDKEGEWIELYNRGDVRVNLRDWRVTDASEAFFSWGSDSYIPGDGYYLLERAKSGITLNNGGDTLNLYAPGKQLADRVTYPEAPENRSYALGENSKWFWSIEPTPGAVNRIILGHTKSDVTAADIMESDPQASPGRTLKPQEDYPLVSLEKVREREPGEAVSVRGTVAVLPGVLGLQYFYIIGSPGLQIYNYQKEFPEMAVGDMVEARGELSEARGELRLKTDEVQDIKVVAHLDPPMPEKLACRELPEIQPAQLVEVKGKVVEKKGNKIYLDDGAAEALIYLKDHTGIDTGLFQEGSQMEVTGILAHTEFDTRIMPRSLSDVQELSSGDEQNTTEVAAAAATKTARVLGETASGGSWQLPPRDSRTELYKYLLVAAVAVIVILGGYIVKEKILD